MMVWLTLVSALVYKANAVGGGYRVKDNILKLGILGSKVFVYHIIGDYLYVLVKVCAVVVHCNLELRRERYVEVKLIYADKGVYRKPRHCRRGH